jgi:hypothetical protein
VTVAVLVFEHPLVVPVTEYVVVEFAAKETPFVIPPDHE